MILVVSCFPRFAWWYYESNWAGDPEPNCDCWIYRWVALTDPNIYWRRQLSCLLRNVTLKGQFKFSLYLFLRIPEACED